MTRREPCLRRRASVLAATAVLAALVGGCSGDDEPSDLGSVPSSTAGSGGETPLAVEEDGLPADFPREEVPVVDGEIVSVAAPDGKDDTYSLLLYLGDTSRSDAIAAAVAELEDAGWTAQTTAEGEEPAPQLLTKSGGTARRVLLTAGEQRDETALTYSVAVSG